MSMVSFHTRFRDVAARETRHATVVEDRYDLPAGTYGFLESYCDEPGCDCRRVVIQVVALETGPKVWATINFGWESEEFYEKWVLDAELARFCAGAWLDPLNKQTRYAPALLELFRFVAADPAYVERLKRHYEMFKGARTTNRSARRGRKKRRRR